ncbi:MAG: PAS domain S-box protein [Nitrospirae bacterium]|uniref:sensor histidine kinase n=1 Tax=Candidatus Magnetobacterium casense TaxID=1455061 RepID=UPI00069639F8|nr:PAS domain S-box protein [Candidatus Magnetobacterium casensis]MBF0337747.1 PAS domain S-box protein [Nitrospirota bacterium]
MTRNLFLRITDIFRFGFNRRIFLSFGVLIIISVVSSLYICLFGVPYTSVDGIYNNSLRQMEDNLESFAELKKQQVEKWIWERRVDAEIVAESFYVKNRLEILLTKIQGYRLTPGAPNTLIESLNGEAEYRELVSYLDKLQAAHYGQYEEIYITDAASGTIIVSTNAGDVGSHAHIKGQGERDLLTLIKSAHGSGINLVISHPVNTCAEADVPCIGSGFVLYMHANVQHVFSSVLYAGSGLGKTAEVVLVDKGARTLTPLKHLPAANVLEYRIDAAPARLAARGNEGLIEAIDYRGELVLAAFRHILVTPEIGIGMVFKVDKAELMAPVMSSVVSAIWVMVLGLFMLIAITYLISLKVSGPVVELIKAAESIKDGDLSARVPVNVSGDLQTLVQTFNDMLTNIEYQQRATEAVAKQLRLSEERYRTILTTSVDGFWIVDFEKRLVFVNEAYCNISGYSQEELLQMRINDLEVIESPEDTQRRIMKIKESGWDHFETKHRCKDGSIIDIDASVNFIKSDNVMFSFIRDITERKRLESELRELNLTLESRATEEVTKRQMQEQMLIQQSKMASMGEMIGVIAHQWKQPLNSVGIIVQDLKDAWKFGEIDEQYINDTVASAMAQVNFMGKTIDDFRNFFKPSKQKVSFDVKTAIEDLISMFKPVFNKNNITINLQVEHPTGLVTDGYPNEFKQVILNILNNSKDAIIARGATSDGLIELKIASDEFGTRIVIVIRDNGGGIPAEVIGRIFEPYFTTKGSDGTGIGLYMSKTIIETNMGGGLTVRNVDGGAEFTITLMRCDTV